MTNITYTTQTEPNTGIAAGHNKLQSHAQSPLRKNTGVGFLQTWNGRLNLLWFYYIFFISRLLPGLLMGCISESFLPIFLPTGGNGARGESAGQKG